MPRSDDHAAVYSDLEADDFVFADVEVEAVERAVDVRRVLERERELDVRVNVVDVVVFLEAVQLETDVDISSQAAICRVEHCHSRSDRAVVLVHGDVQLPGDLRR